MADKRKLHGEIDRCLKKVAEGVETFEDIWKKVHSASNANQKEKYEADLKKEIKKLQRLRDQIKTWLTSNDIKDKRPLMDNRKLIETQMERFKIVERETKTKAYSKEGLGLAAKVDPAQREKEEVRQWLTESIDKLNLQIDQFEAEVESLYASSRKRKLDRDKQDRVDELNEWTERHRFHVQKLETIMRMMDNCTVETDSVKLLQDDLNYYVESNQEPDFAENEMMYDDLELEESSIYTATTVIATPTAPHQAINEEEVNSIASSPSSSQGPLSPKTPTTMKSTSQELFDERRRGKTSVSSSSDNPNDNKPPPPVSVPSPRKPVNKLPLLQNSTLPLRSMSHSGNKVTTPTTTTPSKSNSLGRSVSSGAPPSNGSASPRGASKPAQLPQGPAYSIAAGGQQNSGAASSNSSSSPTSTTPHPPHKETTSSSSPQAQPQEGPSLHSSTGGGGSTTAASGVPSSAVPTSVDHSQQVLPTQSVPPAPGVAGTTTSGSVAMEVPANAPSSMAPSVTSTAQTQHQPAATQQPRPHAINTKPEHSRTSSSSSSFSPSTLSQDSQPTLSQSGTAATGVEVSLVNSVGGAQPCTSASPISEATPLVVETSHHPQQLLSSPADSQPSSALSPNNTPSSEMSPAASTTSSVGGGVARTVATATPVTTLSSSGYQPAPPPSTTSLAQLSLAQPLSGSGEGVVSGSGLRLPVTLTTVSETQSTGMTALIQQAYQSSSSGGMEYPSWMSVTSGGMATSSANAISSFMANTGASSVGSPPLSITSPSPLIMAVSQQQQQQQQSQTASHSPFTSSSTPLTQVPPSSPFTTAAVSGLLTVQPTSSGSVFAPSESSPAVSTDSTSRENPPSSLKAMAAQVVAASSSYGVTMSTGSFPHDSKAETVDQTLRPMLDPSVAAPGSRITEGVTPAWTDTQLQPLLGVTPLGPVQLSQEKTYQLRMLEGACKHLPQPSDSERVRPYLMRNPYPTPYYYHQHPPTHFDSFEFFQRLSIETLFFIFYYMEGTKAQFMAAKALKKLSWRFHTKYMMWFQRLEEPKAITDDYEMGTYIYFDFEKWSQRKKEGFTFEYRYLEDRDLQ